jgi:hypothetical protein
MGAFDASNNQLSGELPSLDGLAYLDQFYVGGNHLTGSVPPVPSSSQEVRFSARLCPNPLTTTASPNDTGWDTATGYTPWWATPFTNNLCDDIFSDGFDE